MAQGRFRIGVAAPSGRFAAEAREKVRALAAAAFPEVELVFHPQCELAHGHFAGPDAARTEALVELANDESLQAIWIARGGYGACRVVEAAIARMGPAARRKVWLGYSDAGFLLAGLYRAGFSEVAHGPMCQDAMRPDGEAAVMRALAWLTRRDAAALEPTLATDPRPAAAFNLTVLGHLLGTPLEPDLGGHVLMVEEVSEHMYRIDRAFFHLLSTPSMRTLAGLRLGRCSDIPPNDPDFGQDEVEVARHWCAVSGVPYLGRADIGHDGANRVVPFGPREAKSSV